jgi:hypothetical protein
VIWRTLRHANVLPLLGVIMFENQFAMVSEWMGNGNINKFVKDHPSADRLELVRFPFGLSSSLYIDVLTITVARGCHQGINLHARPGNNPRRS